MAMANGSSNGGGNGSVYWEVNNHKGNAIPVLKNLAVDAAATAGIGNAKVMSVMQAPQQQLPVVAGNVLRGEVKLGPKGVEGHTDSNFSDIGISRPPKPDDRPGTFRVRLRFRDSDLPAMNPDDVRWIMERAKRMPDLSPETESWFLEIDVPAIHRDQPASDAPWPDQPWEIHWEW